MPHWGLKGLRERERLSEANAAPFPTKGHKQFDKVNYFLLIFSSFGSHKNTIALRSEDGAIDLSLVLKEK